MDEAVESMKCDLRRGAEGVALPESELGVPGRCVSWWSGVDRRLLGVAGVGEPGRDEREVTRVD